MTVTTLAEQTDRDRVLSELRRVFLVTSRQQLEDAEERDRFFRRWTGFYIERGPGRVLLALEEDRLLGYLTGCDDSRAAATELAATIASYRLFADLFDRFPAHLHVNVDPPAQGRGIGRTLVEAYASSLRNREIAGVHIVTAADAANTGFYASLGFGSRVERSFEDRRLLFMGRTLKP